MVILSMFRPLLTARGHFAVSASCRRAPVVCVSAASRAKVRLVRVIEVVNNNAKPLPQRNKSSASLAYSNLKTMQPAIPSARRWFAAIGDGPQEGLDVEGAKSALRRAQAVCFDVDSTVIAEEGIDVLADFCGAAEAVAELTSRAMGGSMPFQDALKARLDLMTPSQEMVDHCLREHPPRLSPGISELVSALHERGVVVYLVSGGFRQMIAPVADQLSIPRGNIFANRLLFGDESSDGATAGAYVGFDADEPTSRGGGKAKVIDLLSKEFGYKCVVMVGDGATDMEAKPPADAFIGYGGVTVRQSVRKGADWFVTDFGPLVETLRDSKSGGGGAEPAENPPQ